MKIKIKLGTINMNNAEPVMVPFWFTSDKSIHISHLKPEIELDTDNIDKKNIYQIMLGIKKRMISVAPRDKFNQLFEDLFSNKEVEQEAKKPTKTEEKAPADQKEIIKKKLSAKEKEAKELITKSVAELTSIVGSGALNEEGLVQPGINDTELLNFIINFESDTKAPRKTVLNMVNKRLAILEEHGIEVVPEPIKVEEEDDRQIKYDPETQTFNELENQESEETSEE